MTIDAKRIMECAEKIVEAQRALSWLSRYGPRLNEDPTNMRISLDLQLASAVAGAPEARKFLTRQVRLNLRSTIDAAISNCHATINSAAEDIEAKLSEKDNHDD